MSLIGKLVLGLMVVAVATPALSAEKDTENRAYVGVSWQLGESFTAVPDLVVGVRSLRVSSNNDVNGADLSAKVTLKGGLALDSSRLVYVGGERDLMGNLGVGYSFASKSLLATAAVQGPYTRAGVDYEIQNKAIRPYVELNSLDKPNPVDSDEFDVVNGVVVRRAR